MSSVGRFDNRALNLHLIFDISHKTLCVAAAGADLLIFVAASVIARAFYSSARMIEDEDVVLGIIAALFFILLGKSAGLYRFQTLLVVERALSRIAAAALLAVLAVVCLLFLLKTGSEHSRGATSLFALTSAFLVPSGRIAFSFAARKLVEADFVHGRRVVLVGEIDELERLTSREMLHFGFAEVARFGLSRANSFELLSSGDRLRVGQAVKAARALRAAEFALVIPWSRDRALAEITACLRSSPLPVRLYPDHHTRDILVQKRERHFDPYLSVEIQREPLNRWERSAKRAFDVALAGTALIWLSPLLVFAALLIKLDSSGPVIFRQTRRGFDNREFRIWKFRTMTVLEDGPALQQAQRDDDRVTRLGKILRRTSVDELPQLVNVLRGEMSVVGPRPHAVAHDTFYEDCIGQYALRRHVKPGLTGAAQVKGLRGETRSVEAMEARVQRDLWYINHWSLWLDLKIVLQTFGALIRHQAY
jgi:Undecaprenyl-phosphate glucose phosphotransferase